MKALIQRVQEARVDVSRPDGVQTTGQIGAGLLVLLGVEARDSHDTMQKLMQKCLDYRIFADDNGKMNLNLVASGGELLLVSQFTLCADTGRGLRPSFSKAAPPALAEDLYQQAAEYVFNKLGSVATGEFGANMQVHLINDGPVTFLLES
ncbi:MAG: D-aminoacyl-tRNA deacylase [Pseudomonadales bacterium]